MAPPLKSHCRHGHPFNVENTRWTTLTNGYSVRMCRKCRSDRDRRRYRDDPEYAAKVLNRTALRKAKVRQGFNMSTTENAYKVFVDQMFAKRHEGVDGYLHAAIGMSGEAGEVLDLIKKVWVYGKPLDVETYDKLVEELGDVMFYMQAMMNLLRQRPGDVRTVNCRKLRKRYPAGYSDAAAIARRDKADGQAA